MIARVYLLALVAALMLAMAGTASADLLVNPGFEDPIGAEWVTTILTGDTAKWVAGASGARVHSGSSAFQLSFGPIADLGHAYVQQVVTGLVPGGTCTVSGWVNMDWRATKAWAYVEALGGGAPVSSPAKGANVDDSWVQYQVTQTADALGQLTVRLHMDKYVTTTSDKTCIAYFDDAIVEGPVTPEPGGMIAVLSGLIGLAGYGIRRRR